jgi:5-oxopent-3-ene-1,2,5-tricarboxylate decarboxylase/2-hydroxyhepta-2,4-diene-1,7-dioate isomerase
MWNISELPVCGTVYGTLLNHRDALAALGDQVNQVPYKASPKAPILYIKPRNTIVGDAALVAVPADVTELEMGATLGVVIGQTASKLRLENALEYVAGYTIVNDISVPHASFYRPSMRFKCRDGFCPMGPVIVPSQDIKNPDNLAVTVSIDGKVVQQTNTDNRIRKVAQLLVDVTDFMTLHPGDVLSIGVSAGAPLAKAGQQVTIAIEGIGQLESYLVAGELV